MFTFISIMAVGVLIGYPLRRKQSIHKIPVLIHRSLSVTFYFGTVYRNKQTYHWQPELFLPAGSHHLHAESVGKLCSRSPCVSLFL